MALSIVHFARWLAWQLGDSGLPEPERPASITVVSGSSTQSAKLTKS